MLIDKTINTKWNSKTKSYYESLGYQYTKMGDSFAVLTNNLKPSSGEKINLKCDYCGKQYAAKWSDRQRHISNSPISKDACKKCGHLKAKEVILKLYNVSNIIDIEGAREKRDKTILSIYGVSNVFKSEKVKEKIRKTNLSKYGNVSFTKTALYEKKRKTTCLKKYGVESHTQTKEYRSKYSGTNSPLWKGGIHDVRWERLQPIYRAWRLSVFKKDGYLCQKCFKHKRYLEAHHIFNWNDNPDKRYEPDNGITFCRDCHNDFHREYGKKNNTRQQLTEFLHQT